MSTMVSFVDNSLSSNFLTMSDLKAACPMAFKSEPTNPNVSEKFILANTATVVEDLGKLGWYPVQAKQCRSKKGSSGIRSFHMIAFQNPNVKIQKPDANGNLTVDTWPRIILTNSHDGFNSFRFRLGLFRCVCSNGLVVATDEMMDMSIRHINYDFETLRRVVSTAVEQVPYIVNTMNTMKGIEMKEEDKRSLAESVIRIRKNVEDGEKFNISEETIRDILMPTRPEDTSNDLWTVFNICQEKMIKGGFMAPNGDNKKIRRQRSITSAKKDIEFNQKLWAVAQQYMPAVAEA